MKEEVYGAWLDGELIGTVSWHAAGNSGSTASIGGIFVRHPRLGIGRRLLAEAEARAHQCGFERLSACATANAVPFFLRVRLRDGLARRALAVARLRAAGDASSRSACRPAARPPPR